MNNCITANRLGVIKVSVDVLESISDDGLSSFWAKFFPLEIVTDPITNIMTIECASPLFDVCDEPVIPEYRVMVTVTEVPDGVIVMSHEFGEPEQYYTRTGEFYHAITVERV